MLVVLIIFFLETRRTISCWNISQFNSSLISSTMKFQFVIVY